MLSDNVEKKILFVVLQLDAGGSERVVLDLARNLNLLDFEVYVAAFKGGVLEPAFREVCKEIFFIEKKRGFDLSAMLKLSKVIKQNNIDVVNAHHYMPCLYSFLGSCFLQRKKMIYTEHSVPEVVDVAKSKHGKIFYLMLHYIHAVIGVSREITDEFKRSYPKYTDKFKVILNGVDIEKFKCSDRREEIRSQFGFSPEHFVVGMVANFRKVKNHACLLRAVARLKSDCPQLRILLVGTGFPGDTENSEGDIRAVVDGCDLKDRVVFAGYQEDIPAMLSAFDAFCLPSFSEGLPVSVLEAMASGLVVIGSNVSGISEVIEHGKTGFLFKSNSDKDLACLIEKITQMVDDGQPLQQNIEIVVNEKYSKRAWINNIIDVYSDEK